MSDRGLPELRAKLAAAASELAEGYMEAAEQVKDSHHVAATGLALFALVRANHKLHEAMLLAEDLQNKRAE